MMGKVFVFLADGFEEIEGLTVVDMLRRAEIPTVTVSIGSSKNIIGAHRIEVEADIMFHEVIEAEGAMYVLPGGMPGTLNLGASEIVNEVVKKFAAEGKIVAALIRLIFGFTIVWIIDLVCMLTNHKIWRFLNC